MSEGMTPAKASALRKAFPEESIGKLPKGGVLLDYVGHAAVTDRLLTVDPDWSWEPFAVTPEGLPALDRSGNLWIRLTVCGVTRIGVGDGKNAKEVIGDAIRNAAMRFGVALDLWAKENLVEFDQAANPPQRMSNETADEMSRLFHVKGIAESARLTGINAITGAHYGPSDRITEDHAQQVCAALRKRPDATEQPVGGGGSSEGEASEPAPPTGEEVGESGGSPTGERPNPRKASRAQHRMIFATLKDLGVDDDRDERLLIASTIVGRVIGSFDDLTVTDATQLVKTLADLDDKAALNALLDSLGGGE